VLGLLALAVGVELFGQLADAGLLRYALLLAVGCSLAAGLLW
jgi:hypothetical protein